MSASRPADSMGNSGKPQQDRSAAKSLLVIAWASPWSLVGLAAGCLACLTGGRGRRRGIVLEFSGGVARSFLERLATVGPAGAAAITIGHVILGVSDEQLDRCRSHELVHVRQYERWGPFFVPLYLGSSFVVWMNGGDFHRDNIFEREAFSQDERDANIG